MQINFLFVGTLKEKYLEEGVKDYLSRLKHYAKINVIRLKEVKDGSINDIIKKETELILKKLDEDTYVIVLDLKGKEVTSEELAALIQKTTTYYNSNLTFVIGGSYGFTDELRKRADICLSLSKLTFPHQLIELFLLEQIYRSFKIINNEKYHK